jgi:integrase
MDGGRSPASSNPAHYALTSLPEALTVRRLPPAVLASFAPVVRNRRRTAELFEAATGGWTLHQLRHPALTHAAEDGANTSTLPAYSGHTSVASPARYSRVFGEALARWQAGRDPAARRR